jgi:hypothetical protein
MAQGDGVSLKSARYLAMQAVINSKEGQAAMLKAISDGYPPLCGVDPLLANIIIDYAKGDDQMLMSAGSLVAEHLVRKGYAKGKIRNCPASCIAKTGSSFNPSK